MDVKAKALETLDNMKQEVNAELVISGLGLYAEGEGSGPIPVCGGHKVCLIGAAWVAHGDAHFEESNDPDAEPDLVGTMCGPERLEYLSERPALAMVFEALNDEAEALHHEYPEIRMLRAFYTGTGGSYAEALFEGGDLTRHDLLALIAAARRRIEATPSTLVPRVHDAVDLPMMVPVEA
jgi:hypothetical protein